MSTNGLSPPGSSTYSSNLMYVGDGTWDSDRNDFLLPNLQGLNFATMQYNGMGNRFRDLPQYHVLILGHGVLAAIVFVVMVPSAIFIARFWHSESRLAFKMHVYIQILVVFLTTVILILGWFAVGPERSLTNPHHGIGVAIYVCILAQFLYGWLMYRGERKRTKPPVGLPLRVHIHKLFGRAVAVLGFVQIALGLTLYGSPKSLFILYALAGALILFLYLSLAYSDMNRIRSGILPRPPMSDYYSDYDGSYVTGTQTGVSAPQGRPPKEESHWGRNALAAAGLFGAYEWWKSKRDKRRNEKEDRYTQRIDSRLSRPSSRYDPRPGSRPSSRPPEGASQYGPDSHYGPASAAAYGPGRPHGGDRRHAESRLSTETWEHDEDGKYNQQPPKHTWRDRLLAAGAGFAAFEGLKSVFGGRKDRRDDDHAASGRYRPPAEGGQTMVSQTDVSRVEVGQAPFSPNDRRRPHGVQMDTLTPMSPSRPPPRRRPSVNSIDYSDDENYGPPRRHDAGHDDTLKESIAALGVVAGLREWNKQRKERKVSNQADKIRQQQMEEEERFKRYSSGHYPLPEHANGRRNSMSGTLLTGPEPGLGSNPEMSRQSLRPNTMQPPLPAAAGEIPVLPGGAPLPGPLTSNPNTVNQTQYPASYTLPPPPPGPPPAGLHSAGYQPPPPGSLQMPEGAVDPDPTRLLSHGHAPHAAGHIGEDALAAGVAGGAVGALAAHQTHPQSPGRYYNSRTRLPGSGLPESVGTGSISQLDQSTSGPSGKGPPVSLKVKMHNDGRHVTLRRLNEEEAAAEREARRRERRNRRGSSLSSVGEDSSSRFRRNAGYRPSSQQPITNVPPPPGMSNVPPGSAQPAPPNMSGTAFAGPSRLPQASVSPPALNDPQGTMSPPPHLPLGSNPASSGAFPSPGNILSDAGTGTDVSAFDSNRRRRRAERARRDAAAKGTRVEFE